MLRDLTCHRQLIMEIPKSITPRTSTKVVIHTINTIIDTKPEDPLYIEKQLRWKVCRTPPSPFPLQNHAYPNIHSLHAPNSFKTSYNKEHLTSLEFDLLSKEGKRQCEARFALTFAARFFEFTRDGEWMEDAVRENVNWIYVDGMSAWHIKQGLSTFEVFIFPPSRVLFPPPS